jgi:two-component system chemotaxis response regulator CheY
MRVLVADQSEAMRTTLRRSLDSVGLTGAVEAADGQQALDLFKAGGGFDLVLTDWNLPSKSGVELVREIRALDPKIPIIMVTSQATKAHVLEAIGAGVSDYVVKPFPPELLRKKLARFAS